MNGWAGLRRAATGLRREPMLALTATLTLAIAIGANTTVFSIVDSILIRPLPYPSADRLYWIPSTPSAGLRASASHRIITACASALAPSKTSGQSRGVM
jgi:hypothetical protein